MEHPGQARELMGQIHHYLHFSSQRVEAGELVMVKLLVPVAVVEELQTLEPRETAQSVKETMAVAQRTLPEEAVVVERAQLVQAITAIRVCPVAQAKHRQFPDHR